MDKAGKMTNLTRMQQRIDTAENWTKDNPVLMEGEIGYESQGDLKSPKEKVGDGSTAWNDLPYREDGQFTTYVTPTVTLKGGEEHAFTFPKSERILTQVYEVSDGNAHDNTNISFDSSLKYNVQNNGTTSIGSGEAQLTGGLDEHTKLLLNFNNDFQDASLSNQKTITNSGVTFDSTNYKFGGYSACFDGSSYLTTSESTDFEIKNGDFTIDWWMKTGTPSQETTIVMSDNYNWDNKIGWKIGFNKDKYLYFANVPNSFACAVYAPTIFDNTWHHIELVRNGDNMYWFFDGIRRVDAVTSANNFTIIPSPYQGYGGTCKFIYIGYSIPGDAHNYVGNLDSFRISNVARHTGSFTPPNAEYYQCPISTPYYFSTTDSSNYSLSNVTEINSLVIPVSAQTGTSVKMLTSFDGRQSWMYHDTTGWHKYTGTLNGEWTSFNSNTELQTYFTSLSAAQLAADAGFAPMTLDFIFQLEISPVSPVVSALTMNYTAQGDLECADVGSYNDTSSRYGLRITSDTQLSVKNKDTASHEISVYIVPVNNAISLS